MLDVTGLSKEEKELTKEIHAHLNTLIRKGRAFGIHLFLATQRPAVDVVGGALKNNASCRIAGKCDEVLSRMILDDSIAADMVPKDSVGVFVNQDGIVFKGFVFDENENIEIPFRWHGEGDLRATSGLLMIMLLKQMGYTPGQMSTFTEMGLSTWFRRKRYPNEFRVKELQELSKKLDIDFVIHNGEMQAKIV